MPEYARESVAVWDEMMPLLEAHYREIAVHQDIPLAPNKRAYVAMDEAGMLRVYTVREAGELVGYAVYFVNPAMHYSGSLQAVQDVLFLRADLRRGRIGMRLIAYADDQLRADGVQVVYQHIKAAHDFGALLERLGYKLADKVYAKRLDRG